MLLLHETRVGTRISENHIALSIRNNVACIDVFVDGLGYKRNSYFLYRALCQLRGVLNVVFVPGSTDATFALVSDGSKHFREAQSVKHTS